MAEQQEPEESEIFVRLMAAIDDNYLPAKNIQEADVYMTTQQILENLSEMCPGIDKVVFSDFMLQNGFVFDKISDMEFAWLLKNRS